MARLAFCAKISKSVSEKCGRVGYASQKKLPYRPDGSRVGDPRTAGTGVQAGRTSVSLEPAGDPQRHLLHRAQWRSLASVAARPATVADRLSLFSAVAPRWHPRSPA